MCLRGAIRSTKLHHNQLDFIPISHTALHLSKESLQTFPSMIHDPGCSHLMRSAIALWFIINIYRELVAPNERQTCGHHDRRPANYVTTGFATLHRNSLRVRGPDVASDMLMLDARCRAGDLCRSRSSI